jgi:HTH-type transcriptional regulator, transcriptional repressor of NAD biosynthesis genes
MKRGLIIGKFMPIHNGHLALINFATAHCDELVVSMSFTTSDSIPPVLRFSWIKEIFSNQHRIKPVMISDDFDDESLPLRERTKKWSDHIKKIYPPIDVVFSSENYGEPFAFHLQAAHYSFDPERKVVPVSATLIRKKPFKYWDFIPRVVRPYFVKKICFYGPESTGKTVLVEKLAEIYQTEFVPEVARELISSNDFTAEDIIKIGHAQLARIEEKIKTANRVLFCDTDVITTQLYSRHYLGSIPEVLYELERKMHYDLYFLMDIDVPWVADGMRDLGNERQKMFAKFRQALVMRNLPFILVQGSYDQREETVVQEINRLLD